VALFEKFRKANTILDVDTMMNYAASPYDDSTRPLMDGGAASSPSHGGNSDGGKPQKTRRWARFSNLASMGLIALAALYFLHRNCASHHGMKRMDKSVSMDEQFRLVKPWSDRHDDPVKPAPNAVTMSTGAQPDLDVDHGQHQWWKLWRVFGDSSDDSSEDSDDSDDEEDHHWWRFWDSGDSNDSSDDSKDDNRGSNSSDSLDNDSNDEEDGWWKNPLRWVGLDSSDDSSEDSKDSTDSKDSEDSKDSTDSKDSEDSKDGTDSQDSADSKDANKGSFSLDSVAYPPYTIGSVDHDGESNSADDAALPKTSV
jgi:hypothetical protein